MEKSTHTTGYLALRAELRNTREAAGLSQRALAKRLKVPHSWVAKVESGERRIDLIEFAWFVAACELDPMVISERLLKRIAPRRTGQRGNAK